MLKFLKFLVFLLMLTILIKGLFIFASKDFFKVVNVKVEGDNELIKFDITEKILQIKDNTNLVYINTKKMEKYLSEDVRIKNVKITKVYPSELVVRIEGNKPYSYLRQKNNFYVINDTGEIFANINEISDKNLPVINAENKDDLETILQVLSKIKNEGFFSNISEVRKVKSVKIKKVYPSELIVRIEGNKPYSYLRQKNNFYVINSDGEIFANINEITDKNLPVINAENKEDLETILQVLSKIKNEGFFSNISEVRKVKSDYEILLNDGTLIKTAIVVDTAKYDNCFKLHKSLINENKKVEYIDLRFKDINLKEKDLLQTNLEGKNGRDPK